MKAKFKNTITSRFKFIWPIYLYLIMCVVFVYYMVHRYTILDLNIFAVIGISIFIILSAPQLIIHFQYMLKNWNDTLIIDEKNESFEYYHHGKIYSINFNDIKYFNQNLSHKTYNNQTLFFPWLAYNYVNIILHDGQSFYITCFLIDRFKIESSKVETNYIIRYYPNIK